MRFGDKLGRILRKRGLNANQLATLTGLSRAAVGYWLQNLTDPKWSVVQKLATILECSTEDLRDDDLDLPDVKVAPVGRPRKSPPPGVTA